MRETCARVLAAALMTGAIATAMGLPTLFDSAQDSGRVLTAPPSSLQRSLPAPALFVPVRRARAERLVAALSIHRSASRLATVRSVPSRRVVRAPRSAPPPATAGQSAPPAPKPETRELATTTPEPAVPTPAPTPHAQDGGTGHGKDKPKDKGKAKGHDQQQGQDGGQPTAPAVEAAPPAPPVGPEQEAEPQN